MFGKNIETIKMAESCFIEFKQKGIYSAVFYCDDDDLLESFFEFIDLLEEKAKTDKGYYAIIADCYEQVGDSEKALQAFSHVYNPKDKKHIKKAYTLEHIRMKKVSRPSKRKATFPSFKYLSKKICNELFEKGEKCTICGKMNVALYIGESYSNGNIISWANREDKFCANCVKGGAAAEKKKILFNSAYILGNKKLKKQAFELVYKTPGIDSEIWEFSEDGWMICCDDFCVLDRSGEGYYIFKCKKCNAIYEVID